MRYPGLFPSLAALLVAPVLGAQPPDFRASAPKLVVVKMVDVSATEFRFEPAAVTVSPGDTLRFVQTTATPHNVDFRATPEGAVLGPAKMGPFLTAVGQQYDLVIDARFPAGTYQFVCTPHEMMGMKGSFTVAAK